MEIVFTIMAFGRPFLFIIAVVIFTRIMLKIARNHHRRMNNIEEFLYGSINSFDTEETERTMNDCNAENRRHKTGHKILFAVLVIGLIIMLFSEWNVRVEYRKGYYDVTDLISDLFLVVTAFIFLTVGQTALIGFLPLKEYSDEKLRMLRTSVTVELLIGIIPIALNMIHNISGIDFITAYPNEPMFRSQVIMTDIMNGISLIITSVVSLILIKRRSKKV